MLSFTISVVISDQSRARESGGRETVIWEINRTSLFSQIAVVTRDCTRSQESQESEPTGRPAGKRGEERGARLCLRIATSHYDTGRYQDRNERDAVRHMIALRAGSEGRVVPVPELDGGEAGLRGERPGCRFAGLIIRFHRLACEGICGESGFSDRRAASLSCARERERERRVRCCQSLAGR